MTHLDQVPLWAAIPVALLVVVGSSLALIGSYGQIQIRSFYDRLHVATLASSWGTGGVTLSSIALFSVLGSRLAVHEIFIALFITLTTPATMTLLGRAALHRDRLEGSPEVPPRGTKPN